MKNPRTPQEIILRIVENWGNAVCPIETMEDWINQYTQELATLRTKELEDRVKELEEMWTWRKIESEDDLPDYACLYAKFPVNEPPYVGSPLCSDWTTEYYTHYIPLRNEHFEPTQSEHNL